MPFKATYLMTSADEEGLNSTKGVVHHAIGVAYAAVCVVPYQRPWGNQEALRLLGLPWLDS